MLHEHILEDFVRFALIQPRSPWGRHPYLPNGVLSVAARCETAGIQTLIIDENLGHELEDQNIRTILAESDLIGIGCLASPFIPEARRIAKALRTMGFNQPILVGGEVILRFASEQFARLFENLGDVRQCPNDAALGSILNVTLPSMFDVSAGHVIDQLPVYAKQAYFGKEWCLFTSHGCAYACGFCGAQKNQRQKFRDADAFRDEANCLARMVSLYGRGGLYEVYCSTLDGLQNPEETELTLSIFKEAARRHGVRIPLRFLATAHCTAVALKRDPAILRRWHDELDLVCIGIGADGPGQDETREHKRSRQEEDRVFDAIRNAGIQPEATMVLGLPGDGMTAVAQGLKRVSTFVRAGVRTRPFVGKEVLPGNDGWYTKRETVEQLLEHPKRFRELDIGCLGSPITHPDARNRRRLNAIYFATVMALKVTPLGCPTQPLLPTESVSAPLRILGRIWNQMMPQDR